MVLWRKHAPGSLKCLHMAADLCLDPYFGIFDLFVTEKALAQYPTPETGPSGKSWGMKEQTVSMDAPLVPETMVSHNFRILTSWGNPVSHVQDIDNGSK